MTCKGKGCPVEDPLDEDTVWKAAQAEAAEQRRMEEDERMQGEVEHLEWQAEEAERIARDAYSETVGEERVIE